MKNILEPWRKFLVEQEAGVSGPEGVSKIVTQPQRTSRFSAEKLKPIIMEIYDTAFKRLERANYQEASDGGTASEVAYKFITRENLPVVHGTERYFGLYKMYLRDTGKKGKASDAPYVRALQDDKFLKWVYQTYIGPSYARSLSRLGAANIWYYDHTTKSISNIRPTAIYNPNLVFVSNGAGGVAKTEIKDRETAAPFGSTDAVAIIRNEVPFKKSTPPTPRLLKMFRLKKPKDPDTDLTFGRPRAIIGMDNLENVNKIINIAAEEMDHIFEHYADSEIQGRLRPYFPADKKSATTKKPAIVPIQNLISQAQKVIKDYWNNAHRNAPGKIEIAPGEVQAKDEIVFSTLYKLQKDIEGKDKRTDYGMGDNQYFAQMIDYATRFIEVKAAIQQMFEALLGRKVSDIDTFCKTPALRQAVEQEDESFKLSVIVPPICKSGKLKTDVNNFYQVAYRKKTGMSSKA